MLVEFEAIAVWTFLEFFKNLASFFIHQNSAGGLWIC
jgi:hypothetical protein